MQANQAQTKQKQLALFDLDHTLLDVDSDYLWGEYIVKHDLVDEAQYRTANQKFYNDYIEGTLDATEYNEFVAQFLSSLLLIRIDFHKCSCFSNKINNACGAILNEIETKWFANCRYCQCCYYY